MDVEIIGTRIEKGIAIITVIDVSEENLRKMERLRGDTFDHEMEFRFDTHEMEDLEYLWKWLKRQKVTKGCKTWGEALHSTIGTITVIAPRYRSWE